MAAWSPYFPPNRPGGAKGKSGETSTPPQPGWKKRVFNIGDELLEYHSKPTEARIFIPTEELKKISLLSKEAAVLLREQSRE